MNKYKNFTTYIGGQAYQNITFDKNIFSIKSNNESASVDQLANEAVVSISNMTVAWSGDNLVINFTPITDTKVLNAVENGDTKIRAQLLIHAGTYNIKGHKGTSTAYKKRGYNYSLKPVTRTPDENKYWWGSSFFREYFKQNWKRVKSHQASMYGRTWVNLTKAQLQAGSVTLTNVVRTLGNSIASYKKNSRMYKYNDSIYYDYAAVLYVPALGPGTSHTFQYHNQGYYKVSSNALIKNQSNVH